MPARFSIGDVLGTSFKLFARKAPAFLLFTAIAYVPLILWVGALAGGEGITNKQLEHYQSGSFYLRVVLDAFSASAIAFGVRAQLSDERAGFIACCGAGLRRFFPSLLVLAVATIAIILGAFLLVVPGVMLMCTTYVVVPASVAERRGLFGSIDRSRSLTLGHRMKIFGTVLVVWLVMFVLLVVVMLVGHRDDYWHRSTYLWFLVGFQVVIGTFSAVVSAVTYQRLVGVEQGLGEASLGKVFE